MKIFVLISFFLLSICLKAQNAEYTMQSNIRYYPDSMYKSDSYIQEKCDLDIYYPANTKGFSTLIWFHGGGLTGGNKEIFESLKNKGIAVVTANYRLHPKVKCPVYIEDAACAVAWVFNTIEKFGGDPNLIFVSGHSAGGYLTEMIGLDKRWLNNYNINPNKIAGLISLSGQAITHFTIRKEQGLPETQPTIDEFAPLFHVRSDASPLMLITGDREKELYGRYEENAYLFRMMKLNGHKRTVLYELDGYGHNMVEPAIPLLLSQIKTLSDSIMKK
jgi:hypothetical protein